MVKLKDWLGAASGVLGLVTTIIVFIVNLQSWVKDPNMLHIFSIASFILFVFGIFWFYFKSSAKAVWKWAGLAFLYLASAAYFIWVGTWIIDSYKIIVERGAFAPEQVAARAFSYQGVDDSTIGEGTGWFEVSTKLEDGIVDTRYTLNYDIPVGSKGHAGIAIWFTNPQDLTDYRYIDLIIKFKDNNARCRFILKDSFRSYGEVILGDGKLITATPDEQSVRIQISKYFSSIALNSVREIDLDANGYYFDGSNSFTVSHIRFVK